MKPQIKFKVTKVTSSFLKDSRQREVKRIFRNLIDVVVELRSVQAPQLSRLVTNQPRQRGQVF